MVHFEIVVLVTTSQRQRERRGPETSVFMGRVTEDTPLWCRDLMPDRQASGFDVAQLGASGTLLRHNTGISQSGCPRYACSMDSGGSDMLPWRGERAVWETALGVFHGPAGSGSATDLIDLMAVCMAFDRDAEIFAEGEPAEFVYKVASGAVRSCKLMSDGRRQIGAFHLAGDIFGLEASRRHSFSAEAIGDARVLVVRMSALMAEAMRDAELIRQLWERTVADLQRARIHMLLLGRKTAQERIAAFLLDMAERLPSSGSVELPMSRQDIADYLGLTIETVSRTMTLLEREGVIAIPASRRILFRDRQALDHMNDEWAA
jgi:CRP/FNR family nitrogen fixation transcriptional regulator